MPAKAILSLSGIYDMSLSAVLSCVGLLYANNLEANLKLNTKSLSCLPLAFMLPVPSSQLALTLHCKHLKYKILTFPPASHPHFFLEITKKEKERTEQKINLVKVNDSKAIGHEKMDCTPALWLVYCW